MTASTKEEEFTIINKKIQEGKATNKDLFKAVDDEVHIYFILIPQGNKSGAVDKSEFKSLTKRLGMSLTDHRINEIFS